VIATLATQLPVSPPQLLQQLLKTVLDLESRKHQIEALTNIAFESTEALI
jgi:hypothetical protein